MCIRCRAGPVTRCANSAPLCCGWLKARDGLPCMQVLTTAPWLWLAQSKGWPALHASAHYGALVVAGSKQGMACLACKCSLRRAPL